MPMVLTDEMIAEFLRRDAAGEPREVTFRELGVSQTWFHKHYLERGLVWPKRAAKPGRPRKGRVYSWTKSPSDRPLGNEKPISLKANEPDPWPGRYEDDPRAVHETDSGRISRPAANRTFGGVAAY